MNRPGYADIRAGANRPGYADIQAGANRVRYADIRAGANRPGYADIQAGANRMRSCGFRALLSKGGSAMESGPDGQMESKAEAELQSESAAETQTSAETEGIAELQGTAKAQGTAETQSASDTKAVPENVQPDGRKAQPPLWKDLLGLIIKAAVVAGFIYVVFTFVFGLTEGDGMMAPSIKAGDLILYYRLDKACVAGDVVVYQADGGDVSEYRVIAQAGDTVDIKDGSLVINGYPQNESYLYGVTTDAWDEGISFPVTVGQDEVFLLCDNRTEGVDSRIFGSVKTVELMGKAVTVIRRRSI